MQPIQKTLKLNKDKYYEMHLNIVNNFLPTKMTPKEMEVLSKFMSFEGDMIKERFGATAKKMVREMMDLSPAGLSNYMRTLIDKGFLIEKVKDMEILSILMPDKEEQVYMFKLINFGDDRGNR